MNGNMRFKTRLPEALAYNGDWKAGSLLHLNSQKFSTNQERLSSNGE